MGWSIAANIFCAKRLSADAVAMLKDRLSERVWVQLVLANVSASHRGNGRGDNVGAPWVQSGYICVLAIYLLLEAIEIGFARNGVSFAIVVLSPLPQLLRELQDPRLQR